MADASIESLAGLEASLRETIKREVGQVEKRQRALDIQKQAWGKQAEQKLEVAENLPKVKESNEQATVASIKTKEEEINRRKAEVSQRVNAQVTRVEQEARRLQELRKELEALEDPTKKEVGELRKKIEIVDRELRPMKALCERKEKELKDAVAIYNEKTQTKSDLVSRLFDIVTESERVRMEKLEELNRHLHAMESKSNGDNKAASQW